ncbi:bromo and FHA domain-containing protein DDB_G0267958-like [Mercenaria mercenaria]|uniref:bromo and FHA domain-containing protein DDB_G0267958-like n=1 Tax=Mercenaria mercenaria TaxID=6596 RepID=UPI00234F5844|nr:bromo and FHA domain-containing protein DDB_G0267958-like [Mercenaria mercenaria]
MGNKCSSNKVVPELETPSSPTPIPCQRLTVDKQATLRDIIYGTVSLPLTKPISPREFGYSYDEEEPVVIVIYEDDTDEEEEELEENEEEEEDNIGTVQLFW